MSRGWTLLEMLVVLGIVAVALALGLSFFYSGQKQSGQLDFRLRAVQSGMLLRSRLADDLAAHIPGPQGSAPIPRAAGLTLLRVPEEKGSGEDGMPLTGDFQPETSAVTWRFDPATHQVLRNGRPLQLGRFRDVWFSWFPYREGEGETVQVHAIAVPDEALASPDRPSPTEVRLDFSFHCPQTTLVRVYDEWIP